jgi:hypothetical protein
MSFLATANRLRATGHSSAGGRACPTRHSFRKRVCDYHPVTGETEQTAIAPYMQPGLLPVSLTRSFRPRVRPVVDDRLVLDRDQLAEAALTPFPVVGHLDAADDREPELFPGRPSFPVGDVLLQERRTIPSQRCPRTHRPGPSIRAGRHRRAPGRTFPTGTDYPGSECTTVPAGFRRCTAICRARNSERGPHAIANRVPTIRREQASLTAHR